MRNLLKNIMIGIAISYLITTAFLLKFAVYYTSEEVVKLFAAWAVFGAVAGASTQLFDFLENKLIASLLHFLSTFLFWALAMSITIPNLDMSIMMTAGLWYIIIYLVIYLSEYYYHKKLIDRLNQRIKDKSNQ